MDNRQLAIDNRKLLRQIVNYNVCVLKKLPLDHFVDSRSIKCVSMTSVR